MRSVAGSILLLLLVGGCAPVVGLSGLPAVLGVGLLAGLGLWFTAERADARPRSELLKRPASPGAGAASAGACGAIYEPPCDGWEHESCGPNGHIERDCCPKGAKCTFRTAPHQSCGDGACVVGQDPGMCVPREPRVTGATTEVECAGNWEKACVSGKVTMACIMPVPTNYSGPTRNPSFRVCGGDRCTTGRFIEACYPEKGAMSVCLAPWTRVCLMGRVTERCILPSAQRTAASTAFVECDAPGTCAIASDKSACKPAAPE